MAKRLTDTCKWNKEWFMELPPEKKLLWIYLCDNCDHAGIWERNLKLASLQLGFTITEKTLQFFGDKLVLLADNKYFLKSFVSFQYGQLTETNNAHRAVIGRLKKYGVDPNDPGAHEPLGSPSRGAQEKDKEMEKDKSFSSPVLDLSSSSSSEENNKAIYNTQREQQIEFQRKCRAANLTCEIEYAAKGVDKDCRFDAVILRDGELAVILEFKKYIGREPRTDTKQLERYGSFGVPIFLIKRDDDLNDVVSELLKFLTIGFESKYCIKSIDSGAELRRQIWSAYKTAYLERYKTEPVRNATINSQVIALAKRLGKEAPEVVKFYVTHNKGFYVGQCHPVGLCLKDAEALRTQWARGKAITTNDVREFERRDHIRDLIESADRGEL
jgi:hypothetical protein